MLKSLTIKRPDDSIVRTFVFGLGLNIVLAKRSGGKAGRRHLTRNGAGKTTLLRILRFCLGGNLDGASRLKSKRRVKFKDRLAGWKFIAELTLGERVLHIERIAGGSAKSDKVKIKTPGWKPDFKSGKPVIRQGDLFEQDSYELTETELLRMLEHELFSLDIEHGDKGEVPAGCPDMGLLGGFFIRRHYSNALLPIEGSSIKASRIGVSHLFGLGCEGFAKIAKHNGDIERAKRIITVFEDYLEQHRMNRKLLEYSISVLDSDITRLKSELGKLRDDCDMGEAIDSSHDAAVGKMEEMRRLNHNIARLRLRLRAVNEQLSDRAATMDEVRALYGDLSGVFKEEGLVSLSNALEFHNRVFANERPMLLEERNSLQAELEENLLLRRSLAEEEIREEKEANILDILDMYAAKSARVSELEADKAVKSEKLNEAVQAEREKVRLDAEVKHCIDEMRREYMSAGKAIDALDRQFCQIINRLYDDADPSLGIGFDDTTSNPGLTYDPYAKKAGSDGVGNMITLAFDLTLLYAQKKLGRGMDFLVHDSLVFDHTDERQVGLALSYISKSTAKRGLQYICMVNSDTLAKPGCQEHFRNQAQYFVQETLGDTEEESLLRHWF